MFYMTSQKSPSKKNILVMLGQFHFQCGSSVEGQRTGVFILSYSHVFYIHLFYIVLNVLFILIFIYPLPHWLLCILRNSYCNTGIKVSSLYCVYFPHHKPHVV